VKQRTSDFVYTVVLFTMYVLIITMVFVDYCTVSEQVEVCDKRTETQEAYERCLHSYEN